MTVLVDTGVLVMPDDQTTGGHLAESPVTYRAKRRRVKDA